MKEVAKTVSPVHRTPIRPVLISGRSDYTASRREDRTASWCSGVRAVSLGHYSILLLVHSRVLFVTGPVGCLLYSVQVDAHERHPLLW